MPFLFKRDVNITNEIRRQESFGSDGRYKVFTADLKGIFIEHLVFQLYRTTDVELRFDNPTFLFCLGRWTTLKVGKHDKIVMEQNEILLAMPSRLPLCFDIKADSNYQFLLISITEESNTQLLSDIQQMINNDLPIIKRNSLIKEAEVQIAKSLIDMQPSPNMQHTINQALHLVELALQKLDASLIDAENNEIVERAKNYILAHLHVKQSTIEACHAAGMTDIKHYSLFEEKFGASPKDFIAQAKFDKACHLSATGESLDHIAEAVGLTVQGISLIFKKKINKTLSQYQMMIKGK